MPLFVLTVWNAGMLIETCHMAKQRLMGLSSFIPLALQAQMYILTRPLNCWYFIPQLSVPAWKLLLPGKSLDSYGLQCCIETCRDVCWVFAHMGGIQTYRGIEMPPKSDTSHACL